MDKKILIVDDDENFLVMLGSRLAHAGYAVRKALNGKDAVTTAKKELPHLIISDIAMPDLDGGEMSNVLSQDSATKDIPVLFLTGLLRKEEEGERKVVKGRSFMAKPFDAEALLKEVKRLLGER